MAFAEVPYSSLPVLVWDYLYLCSCEAKVILQAKFYLFHMDTSWLEVPLYSLILVNAWIIYTWSQEMK